MYPSGSQLTDIGRLGEVAGYDWDNPDLQARMNSIAARTSSWTGAPISVVSVLLDSAQIFVGTAGVKEALLAAEGAGGWIIEAGGIPIQWAFCAPMAETGHSLVYPDLRTEQAHAINPLVIRLGIRGYAGVPVTAPGGQVLGGLCLLTTDPYTLSLTDVLTLEHGATEISEVLREYRVGRGNDASVARPTDEQILTINAADLQSRLKDLLESDADDQERGFVAGLLTSFIRRLPGLLDDLEHTFSGRDENAVRARAHAVRGMAANIGARRLSHLAATVEDQPSPLAGVQEFPALRHEAHLAARTAAAVVAELVRPRAVV